MDQGIGIVPLCPNRQEHLEVLVLKPSGEALRLPTYGFWGGLKVVTRTSMDGTTEAVPLCPNRRVASGGHGSETFIFDFSRRSVSTIIVEATTGSIPGENKMLGNTSKIQDLRGIASQPSLWQQPLLQAASVFRGHEKVGLNTLCFTVSKRLT